MFNKAILVGRMCNDPELRYTPSGVAVANFRLAVDRPFTNKQGERETDFIDIVAWKQDAEFAANYLTKGRLVLIDGRIQVRTWETQDGQRRRSVEVVADRVRGLDRPREDRGGGAEEEPAPPAEESADSSPDPWGDQ
ncbi:MAG TPA: single-stranded DNA-binding protein [Armatimonadota bacterium]|nr:single-stranded DNA-binding protein [Armatimonadota bacterium]